MLLDMICLLSSTERVRFSQRFGALQRVGELWPIRSGNRAFTAARLGLHELDIESVVTSSPTRMPPVSRAAFQVNPKSLRLIFMVAETATRVLPHGSSAGGVGPSTAKRTLWVTPRMVRSPSIVNSPSLTMLMLLDLKSGSETSPHQRNPGSSGAHHAVHRAYESRPLRSWLQRGSLRDPIHSRTKLPKP
jgi:hypothetical protein